MSIPTLPRDFLIQIARDHQLTPKQEQLLVLRFEGKSYEEIAKQLSIAKESCLNLMTKIYTKFSIGLGSGTKGKEKQLHTFLINQFQQSNALASPTSEPKRMEQLKSELEELREQVAYMSPQASQLHVSNPDNFNNLMFDGFHSSEPREGNHLNSNGNGKRYYDSNNTDCNPRIGAIARQWDTAAQPLDNPSEWLNDLTQQLRSEGKKNLQRFLNEFVALLPKAIKYTAARSNQTEFELTLDILEKVGLVLQNRADVVQVESSLPFVDTDIDELKQTSNSVEIELQRLGDICKEFKSKIKTIRNRNANAIADSLRDYINNLSETFAADFQRYQPELKFFKLLDKDKIKKFAAAIEQAFAQYVDDKVSAWSCHAKRELEETFSQLTLCAAHYSALYSQVTEQISEKITGQHIDYDELDMMTVTEDKSPGWARWANGPTNLLIGNVANMSVTETGALSLETALLNIGTGAIMGASANFMMPSATMHPRKLHPKALIIHIKDKLREYLPQVAEEKSQFIHSLVSECFDTYQVQVIQLINDDIQSWRTKLDGLLEQKSTEMYK